MLQEITSVKQDDPTLRRRWFQDDFFDLFVWQSPVTVIVGFQLCYDIHSHERVLSWRETSGFSHNRIDGGEATPSKNMTPILVADGRLPIEEVLPRFVERSGSIDRIISEFIANKLREFSRHLAPRTEPSSKPSQNTHNR